MKVMSECQRPLCVMILLASRVSALKTSRQPVEPPILKSQVTTYL